MYVPAPFRPADEQAVRELVATVGAGDLVTAIPELAATRLPIRWGADNVVRGHLARANPQWQALPDAAPALLIVGGPQAYVSPSYYAAKAEHGRVVPTWDYAVAHLRGTLRIISDEGSLHPILVELTGHFEGRRAQPWHVTDAPADYIDSLLGAIVGIELTVTEVSASFKLSQNRSAADIAGVVDGLSASPDAQERQVAWMVRDHSPQ